ncbi:unnamed protein product, partial [marine sediment metagenome]
DRQIKELPYARYLQILRVASEQKVGDLRMRMREQAYLGWLIYLIQPASKRTRKMSFREWLTNFGLLEEKEKKEKAEDVEAMKRKSLEIAEKIVEMDKRHRS